MPNYAAFLSYSRSDAEKIEDFRKAFEAANLPFWIDNSEIKGGDLWEKVIRNALANSNSVVVFVSSHLQESYVKREIALAVEMKKKIIPVALDDSIDGEGEPFASLRASHYIRARRRKDEAVAETVASVENSRRAPVVAVYNVKGGVGKTTVTLNLGAALFARLKKRVLMVDLDPQHNLSASLLPPVVQGGQTFLGVKIRKGERTDPLRGLQGAGRSTLALLQDAATSDQADGPDFALSKYIHRLDGEENGPQFDVIVGHSHLKALATTTSAAQFGRVANGFGRFIEQCRQQYDCILLDLNPSFSPVVKCGLSAASHVLSPVRPDIYSMQGLDLLDEIAQDIQGAGADAEQMILINDSREDKRGIVRARIKEHSRFGAALIEPELIYSRYFYASPDVSVKSPLTRLSAFGDWGVTPRSDRQSLEKVTVAIAERLGIQT